MRRSKSSTVEGAVFSGPARFPLEQKGDGNITGKRGSVWKSLLRVAHGV